MRTPKPRHRRASDNPDPPPVEWTSAVFGLWIAKGVEARRTRNITQTAMTLMHVLCLLAVPGKPLLPSLALLAERCGCVVSTIVDALDRLEYAGLLRRERRRRWENGRWVQDTNGYTLLLPGTDDVYEKARPDSSFRRRVKEVKIYSDLPPPLPAFMPDKALLTREFGAAACDRTAAVAAMARRRVAFLATLGTPPPLIR